MNEVDSKVLYKFVELLEKYPGGDVKFLWVQAGGNIASQQSFAPDESGLCPHCKDKLFCAMCGESVVA